MNNLPNFADIPPEFALYDKASVVLLPVPYEMTTTYGKGTKEGPRAIIQSSVNIELFDDELNSDPYKVGIHTLPEVGLQNLTGEEALSKIEGVLDKVYKSKKLPVMLGGEHTITTAGVRSAIKYKKNLTVVQLDAHADMRDEYDKTPWSHACVIRRVIDLGVNTVQIGIRSLSREEDDFIKEKDLKVFWSRDIIEKNNYIDSMLSAVGENFYLTIDVDVFDPSIIPSTGTPEPGGLDWTKVTEILSALISKRNLVGVDVVELAPIPKLVAPDFTTAKLVYKLIGYYGRARGIV